MPLLCRTPPPAESQDEAKADDWDEDVRNQADQHARAKPAFGEKAVSARDGRRRTNAMPKIDGERFPENEIALDERWVDRERREKERLRPERGDGRGRR
jgi:hypothetical protein